MKVISRYCFWPLFFTCQLLALALLSWHLAAQIHFAYPQGYKLLGLEAHIAKFAPLNHYKKEFEFVAPTEHWRLFGEISDGIQSGGKGLTTISYKLANGESTPFMHEAEIIHLQDVANLIDTFYAVGSLGALIWLGLIALAYTQKRRLPSLPKILLGFVVGLASLAAIVMAIGAKDVFYWFHEQIFPDGHQWFFYYQDSLMTTLMKAPDIFAFIALLLLGLLIATWGISLYGVNRILTPPKNN